MKLLELGQLINTGPVDHADWNYRPLLGWLQKMRFRLALSLLPQGSARLLEIGYGSGIFMPALSAVATHLAGIDIHEKCKEVQHVLEQNGVVSDLRIAAAESIPFDDATFDAVVAVSSLEFVPDLDAACREIGRVMRPSGCFVVITPGTSKILDVGLKIVTGESAQNDFGDRRQAIVPTLKQHFKTDKMILFPPIAGSVVPLYSALRLKKMQTAAPLTTSAAAARL